MSNRLVKTLGTESDTYLNVTHHGEEDVLERTVQSEHHQSDDHEHRVQQCALERHCHVTEVKRSLWRPDGPTDRLSMHPESYGDEGGRADVHRDGTGEATDT